MEINWSLWKQYAEPTVSVLIQLPKSKAEMLDVDKHSIGPNCSIRSQKGKFKLATVQALHIKSELDSKGFKNRMEKKQRQKKKDKR